MGTLYRATFYCMCMLIMYKYHIHNQLISQSQRNLTLDKWSFSSGKPVLYNSQDFFWIGTYLQGHRHKQGMVLYLKHKYLTANWFVIERSFIKEDFSKCRYCSYFINPVYRWAGTCFNTHTENNTQNAPLSIRVKPTFTAPRTQTPCTTAVWT